MSRLAERNRQTTNTRCSIHCSLHCHATRPYRYFSNQKQKVAVSGLSLFSWAGLRPSAADEEAVDTVLDELKRWEDKDLKEYSQ